MPLRSLEERVVRGSIRGAEPFAKDSGSERFADGVTQWLLFERHASARDFIAVNSSSLDRKLLRPDEAA